MYTPGHEVVLYTHMCICTDKVYTQNCVTENHLQFAYLHREKGCDNISIREDKLAKFIAIAALYLSYIKYIKSAPYKRNKWPI